MTDAEACAVVRARWTHPPLDVRDVEERLALRMVDLEPSPEVLVLPALHACRVFVRSGDVDAKGRRRWCSRYVHAIADVDEVLDALLDHLPRLAAAS